MHTYLTRELVQEHQSRMIEEARLHRLVRAQRVTHLASVVERLRHALTPRRVGPVVVSCPETAACPC
jgi:hypothetical protein